MTRPLLCSLAAALVLWTATPGEAATVGSQSSFYVTFISDCRVQLQRRAEGLAGAGADTERPSAGRDSFKHAFTVAGNSIRSTDTCFVGIDAGGMVGLVVNRDEFEEPKPLYAIASFSSGYKVVDRAGNVLRSSSLVGATFGGNQDRIWGCREFMYCADNRWRGAGITLQPGTRVVFSYSGYAAADSLPPRVAVPLPAGATLGATALMLLAPLARAARRRGRSAIRPPSPAR